MKFAIYGAGSVGGLLGSRLQEGGHEVHFIARGDNLAALRRRGLSVRSTIFGESRVRVRATDAAADIGPADYVVLAVKAGSLAQIAPLVEPLKGPSTTFVSTQNGLPWWYFHGLPGGDQPIRAADPQGVIARHIAPSLVVGSVVYFSCSMTEPGAIKHTVGNRLPLGEPAGGRTERVLALSSALRSAGIKAPVRGDIRHELWVKILGNAAFNPLSALTGATLTEMTGSPHGVRLVGDMMDEVRQVASSVGVHVAISNERRIAGARRAGDHRTSMLQDLDLGREPELDVLLGAVIELAERQHIDVPVLRAIDSATRVLFARAARRSG
ncbi:MAG: 2-dehydropantoate 2-reductase [Bryobacterales bacterium]|nr:2-dehydropantoate 2-reductase [Bryobacterales bacterium]MDE0629438.1 2-dehydropantoate 2-reductase [Bryobacterales bacterium]